MEYLSDDEKDEIMEELTFDEMYPEEEFDDEMKQLLYKSSSVNNDDAFPISPKKEKSSMKSPKKSPKMKESISLKDFTQKLEEEESKNKWINKRTNSKNNIEDKLKGTTRKFNPRLPPYRSIKKDNKEIKIVKDDTNFPSLS